jgi:tol-pal system protein YbgF
MRQLRIVVGGLVAACLVVLSSGCVTVAEHRKLEKRIVALERGETATASGVAGERGRLADLGSEVGRLEGEVERLTGRMEVAEHNVQQALSEAKAARADAAAAAAAVPAGSQPEDAAPAGESVDGANSTELEAYRYARSAWSDGEPDTCIDRFRDFLQTYPSSNYAENASYWMADCYFKRGDFKTAVLRFDDVVARYPAGKRAPDALFRQGEALLRLGPGYGKAAGKAFERVIQEYPESARAQEARKQLEVLGSG